MKKNIAGLGIEPQNCKMSWFETWCLSPQDHEISVLKKDDLLIYEHSKIKYKTTKSAQICYLLLLAQTRISQFQSAASRGELAIWLFMNMNIY